VLDRSPHNTEALLTQAALLARSGKLDAASANVHRVLEREPGNERAAQLAQQLSRALAAGGAAP
jgi:uncharacterized protein HemY